MLQLDLHRKQQQEYKLMTMSKLTSQLIKGISKVLQNLLKYFSGIIISTSSVPLFPV